MKWFKHMCNSSQNPLIAQVIEQFGGDGYMVYYQILERIGLRFDEECRTTVTYSAKSWASFCGISAKKFTKLAQSLAKIHENISETPLLFVEISGDNLTVDCPKLNEIKDNHTGNKIAHLQATDKRLRSDSGQAPDKESESLASKSLTEDGGASPGKSIQKSMQLGIL
jgi:hypothetical protein